MKGKGSEKGSPPEDCKRDLQELLARYKCNAVLTHSESLGNAGRRIPSAAALYQAGSIFNHSCAPNCAATYEESLLSIRTIRQVKEGEELTVSYVDESATTVERLSARSLLRNGQVSQMIKTLLLSSYSCQ